MSTEIRPNQWIADWSENGTNITVPIASFSRMTAADADGETGDIRRVVFAILEQLNAQQGVGGLTTMTIGKVDTLSSNILTSTYTIAIKSAISEQTISAEPA